MSTIGFTLLITGGTVFIVCLVLLIRGTFDNDEWGLGGMLAGCVVALIGLGFLMAAADSDCHRRGGHMVDDGAPYYIKSGNVMAPVQPQSCEVEGD